MHIASYKSSYILYPVFYFTFKAHFLKGDIKLESTGDLNLYFELMGLWSIMKNTPTISVILYV